MLTATQRESLLAKIRGEIKIQDGILASAVSVLPAERHPEPNDTASEEELYTKAVREINRARAYREKLAARMRAITAGDCCECHECGDSISFRRLQAEPTATLCVPCKDTRSQMQERQYGIRPGMRVLAQI